MRITETNTKRDFPDDAVRMYDDTGEYLTHVTTPAGEILWERKAPIPRPLAVKDEPGMLGIPGELLPTSLVLREGLTYAEWAGVGKALQYVRDGVQWWIGDWLRYGERKYGEMYTQALDDTEYSYQAIRDMVWVAQNVQLSDRSDNLSWTHHRAVAGLDREDQKKMLDKAETEGLSVAKLKTVIEDTPEIVTPKVEPSCLVCPRCQYQFRQDRDELLKMFTKDEVIELQGRYSMSLEEIRYQSQMCIEYWSPKPKKKNANIKLRFRNWLTNSKNFATRPEINGEMPEKW